MGLVQCLPGAWPVRVPALEPLPGISARWDSEAVDVTRTRPFHRTVGRAEFFFIEFPRARKWVSFISFLSIMDQYYLAREKLYPGFIMVLIRFYNLKMRPAPSGSVFQIAKQSSFCSVVVFSSNLKSFCTSLASVHKILQSLFRAVKVKAYELRTKSKEDLTRQLEELKTELQQLRVAKVTGGAASKLSKM